MSCFNVGDHNILLCQRDEARGPERGRPEGPTPSPSLDFETACRPRQIPIDQLVYRAHGFFTGRELYFFDPSGNRFRTVSRPERRGDARPPFAEIGDQLLGGLLQVSHGTPNSRPVWSNTRSRATKWSGHHFPGGYAEGRRNVHHVAAPQQDAFSAKLWVSVLVPPPRGNTPWSPGLSQFQTAEKPQTPNIANHRVLFLQLFQSVQQIAAHAGGVLHQAFAFHDFDVL